MVYLPGSRTRARSASCLKRSGVYPGVEPRFYPWPDARRGPDRHDRDMSTSDVVTVRGLRKSYGTRVVVDGLDLDVPAGEIVGLIGAVIGGLILHAVTHGAHTSVKIWKEIVVAFAGAVVLLIIIKMFDRSRGRSRGRR